MLIYFILTNVQQLHISFNQLLYKVEGVWKVHANSVDLPHYCLGLDLCSLGVVHCMHDASHMCFRCLLHGFHYNWTLYNKSFVEKASEMLQVKIFFTTTQLKFIDVNGLLLFIFCLQGNLCFAYGGLSHITTLMEMSSWL